MGCGYWDGLTKRLYSIYDQERANQMAVSDFKDPRSEWYMKATSQDHVEREERMWSDAMHFRDMARVQGDLLREQQERDAERRLWEEKEAEFRAQALSADEQRDHMIGRASGALWKIRQNERTAEQLKRDRNVAVEELEKIKEKFERVRKRRGKPDYNQ